MNISPPQKGTWRAVIDGHRLEIDDPQAWLDYGIALLQTIQPGPDAGKQQQQAALSFAQARQYGASTLEIEAALLATVGTNLQDALAAFGIETPQGKIA